MSRDQPNKIDVAKSAEEPPIHAPYPRRVLILTGIGSVLIAAHLVKCLRVGAVGLVQLYEVTPWIGPPDPAWPIVIGVIAATLFSSGLVVSILAFRRRSRVAQCLAALIHVTFVPYLCFGLAGPIFQMTFLISIGLLPLYFLTVCWLLSIIAYRSARTIFRKRTTTILLTLFFFALQTLAACNGFYAWWTPWS